MGFFLKSQEYSVHNVGLLAIAIRGVFSDNIVSCSLGRQKPEDRKTIESHKLNRAEELGFRLGVEGLGFRALGFRV